MKCKRVRDNLMAYVSQELPPDQTGEIRRHLAGCPSCERELQSASAASEALSLLGREEEAPELIGQVRERLADRHQRNRRVAWLRPAAAFSVALLLMTAGAVWFLRQPAKQRAVHVVRQSQPRAIARRSAALPKPIGVAPSVSASNMPARLSERPVSQKLVMVAQLPPEMATLGRRQSDFSRTHLPESQEQFGERQQSGVRNEHAHGRRDSWYFQWQDELSNGDIPEPEGARSLDRQQVLSSDTDDDDSLAASHGLHDFEEGKPGAQARTKEVDGLVPKYRKQGSSGPALVLGAETDSLPRVEFNLCSQALKDLQDARLGQIALLVKNLSQGKSRLLIGQGASAEPKVGNVVHEVDALPFFTVYPVSSPAIAKLGGMGECVLVGAIALGVEAEPPGARDSTALGRIPMAPPGVYLLAYKEDVEVARPYKGDLHGAAEEESGMVSLMSVSVDKEGNPAFQQVLAIPAKRFTRRADVF